MTALLLALRAWALCSIPGEVSLATIEAAEAEGVDPAILLGYLCSEHGDDWTPSPEACSEKGACGPFQLASTWPAAWGYPLEARDDVHLAAEMAARLVVYTRRRHRRCRGRHDWRAHWKAGPGGRDNVGPSVRRWLAWEAQIKAWRGLGRFLEK